MTECITALEYEGGIVAIDSGQVRPQMAACYLLETGSAVAVIEVGNNYSTPRILEVLRRRGRQVGEVSHVIVTHVHLDHAGGAGSLLRKLPNARLVVHPRGARHMIDPSKLEASARAVYGDEVYEATQGTLVPVPEDRILVAEDGFELDVGTRRLRFMDTPGHARHHFCVWDEQTQGWFSGDTFGISYRDLDTERGAFIFPTTTPVQFDPPVLLDSVDRLMAARPRSMYLTHFGRVQELQRLATDLKVGIEAFAEAGERFDGDPERGAKISAWMIGWLMDGARAHGYKGSDAALREVFSNDLGLNTQGVEFWLDHGR